MAVVSSVQVAQVGSLVAEREKLEANLLKAEAEVGLRGTSRDQHSETTRAEQEQNKNRTRTEQEQNKNRTATITFEEVDGRRYWKRRVPTMRRRARRTA